MHINGTEQNSKEFSDFKEQRYLQSCVCSQPRSPCSERKDSDNDICKTALACLSLVSTCGAAGGVKGSKIEAEARKLRLDPGAQKKAT